MVHSLLLLYDGRLASCSNDRTIKIYNPQNNYNCDITLYGHNGKVFYITQLENEELVSCSSDKTIKIWSIYNTSYKCLLTLEGHIDEVHKVIPLSNHRLASCSRDYTVKIWTGINSFENNTTLFRTDVPIWSIMLMKNQRQLLAGTGSQGKSLYILNINTYQCEREIEDCPCCSKNSLIEIENSKILVGGFQFLTIVNINTYQIETKIYDISLGWVCCFLLLENGNILIENNEKGLREYDLNSCIWSKEKNTHHLNIIFSLIPINKNTYASCSIDKTIKIWEYFEYPPF